MRIESLIKIYLFSFFLLPPLHASIQKKAILNKNPLEDENKIEKIIKNGSNPSKDIPLVISIDNLKELLITNNKDLSKYKSQINQSEAILKLNLPSTLIFL